ncbi:hypothetical protein [Microbacterium sp. NPDC058389]|uniref:hypothetical protein n=1 Tax=Microbacterium sp. NPDC058389 TaxID=3346475 RepID=UPI00365B52B5
MIQFPYDGPMRDPDDEVVGDDTDETPGLDDDRPLDPDRNDDQLNSAAADEQAATEGTLDVEDLP